MNSPELNLWSRLIQGAAGVVLVLSAVLMVAPTWGEAIFYLVYFHQPASPVPVPAEVLGYLRFANGIIGAVMAGWMMAIIALARGPFRAGERWAWNSIAWPLLGWYLIDTAFSIAHGVWGNVLLNTSTALMFGGAVAGVAPALHMTGPQAICSAAPQVRTWSAGIRCMKN